MSDFEIDETYEEARARSRTIRSPEDIRPVRWACNPDKRWVHLTESEWIGLWDAFREMEKKVRELESAAKPADAPTTFLGPGQSIKWVRIPAGSITTNDGRTLTLRSPIDVAATPTTQAQWRAVMGTDPSYHKGDNRPVERVSWLEATEFCAAIAARLLTEEEWEYCALAGSPADPYGPIEEIAWTYENSDSETHDVGLKTPNAFGLYDMLGNVWEWTASSEGAARVLRGGCYYNDAAHVRSAYRGWNVPSRRFYYLGFRCARGVGG